MQAPNVLIFDEPTNDLDIATLTVLEDYLDDFDGAVIIVSHDRYFLDRLCFRTFAFEGGGTIRQYPGGYTDTVKARELRALEEELNEKSGDRISGAQKTSGDRPPRQKKLKFTYMEQKEFETIDDDIAALEAKIRETEEEMTGAAKDYVRLQELDEKRRELNTQLEEKTERWVYLNDLAEQIAAQK